MGRNSNYVGRRRAAAEPTIIDKLTARFRGQAKPRGRHAASPPPEPPLSDDTQVIALRLCHDEG